MRKLCVALLAVFCVLQLVNAQTTYYWNATVGATGATGNLVGGTGNWNTSSNNWLTGPTGGSYKAWPNTNAFAATLQGATGAVTVATPVTTGGITFVTSGYTVAGSNTITISGATGATGAINLGAGLTSTINAPISTPSVNPLSISGTSSPKFTSGGNNNFGSAVTITTTGGSTVMNFSGNNTFSGALGVTGTGGPGYTFGGANTYTGLVTISPTGTPTIDFNGSNVFTGGLTTTVATRIDGNVNGAFGTTGNAGVITLGGNTRFTNASAVTPGTSNAVLNNLTLNSSITGLGATAPGTGTTTYTIDYRGVISGASDVYLGNDVSTTATGGGGLTKFSNSSNTYTGKTIVSSSSTAVFQCGVDNCFPTGTQFVYGLAGGTSAHVGMVDLNGHNIQVASIETTGGGTPTFAGFFRRLHRIVNTPSSKNNVKTRNY